MSDANLDFDELVDDLKGKSKKELMLDKNNRENVQLLGHVLLYQKVDKFKFKLSKIKDKLFWWKNGQKGEDNKE